MRNEITNKEFFARYGIFVGIIIVLFGILIYPIKVSQKSWINNLRSNIEFVLDETLEKAQRIEEIIAKNEK